MRAKKYLILLGAIAVCVGVLWASEPPKEEPYDMPVTGISEMQRDVLKGLQGVLVIVENFRPEAQKYVSREQLQNDVELLLRKYGIEVLTNEEWLNSESSPYLYVNANVVLNEQRWLCAIDTDVQLKDLVMLVRNPKPITSAVTWGKKMTELTVLSNLRSSCRENVKDLVEMFINDYLAANPKQPASRFKGVLEGFPEPNKPRDETRR
ncbi:MAG: hypothetical protein ACYS83_04195 [Planctomycetota bacterium]|jgi:hypothetical protein